MFVGGSQPDRTLKIMGHDPDSNANQPNKVSRRKKGGKQQFNLATEHIDIIAMGEGDANSIMQRMKAIEEQFMANPSLHDPAFARKPKDKDEEDDDGEGNGEHKQFSN